jgi:predicted esterase
MSSEGAPATAVQQPSKKRKSAWLEPLVIEPLVQHTHSIILLHGRGSNAQRFGPELLSIQLPSSDMTLPERFPGARFIFPTAKLRRSAVLKRVVTSQWFDNFSLDDPDQRQDLQYEGLYESAVFVHGLIKNEAKAVGIGNVTIGGLSQGCAMAFHVLMSFDADGHGPLGGFMGMSSWLPFHKQLDRLSQGEFADIDESTKGDDDPFAAEQLMNEDLDLSAGQRAIRYVREVIMDLEPCPVQEALMAVPIWMGHGCLDEKVSVNLGSRASATMEALGWKTMWNTYKELGHWYSAEELEDMAEFLDSVFGNETGCK